MPCRPKLGGTMPNFTMQGCEPGCDSVFKKKGTGWEAVKPECKNVTMAAVEGGELVLGEQKCVCVLPCPEADGGCKIDLDPQKVFKAGGAINTIRCTGKCCTTFFETKDEKDPAHGECLLVVDHNAGDALKCVCVWITKDEVAKRKKQEDEKKQKEDKEKADKEELEKLKKDLEKAKEDLKKATQPK
jgi:hypothetical protein